jgi:hypothetical protein
MNIQSRARAWLVRPLLVLVGAFGLWGATPSATAVADDRLALESRVQAVRQQIHVAAANQSVFPVLAQWGNWNNWGNWRNAWNNWGNWLNR